MFILVNLLLCCCKTIIWVVSYLDLGLDQILYDAFIWLRINEKDRESISTPLLLRLDRLILYKRKMLQIVFQSVGISCETSCCLFFRNFSYWTSMCAHIWKFISLFVHNSFSLLWWFFGGFTKSFLRFPKLLPYIG